MSQIITDLTKDPNYWLIILNLQIPSNQNISEIWNNACKIVCLDGAVNKLKEHVDVTGVPLKRGPDYIIGDFDSIRPESIKWLNDLFGEDSYEIHEFKCQNTTDFEKSLKFISKSSGKSVSIVALNCFGGRLDHTLAVLNSAFKFPQFQLQLMNETCMARIITSRNSVIKCANFKGETCGILPLFGPVTLLTSGLQWNLDKDHPLQFTGQISTSNRITDTDVLIENHDNTPFIWTHQL